MRKREKGKTIVVLHKTNALKKKKTARKGKLQVRKAGFLLVVCYNCGENRQTMKFYTSASRVVSEKIHMKAKV